MDVCTEVHNVSGHELASVVTYLPIGFGLLGREPRATPPVPFAALIVQDAVVFTRGDIARAQPLEMDLGCSAEGDETKPAFVAARLAVHGGQTGQGTSESGGRTRERHPYLS